VRWPAQIELRAGRHIVRPRYEVTKYGRTRIAHLIVERAELPADPGIKTLPPQMGRGYVLPFPLLTGSRFRSIVLPTPMAHGQQNLPLRLEVFDQDGVKRGERFLGNLPRDHLCAVDLAEFGVEPFLKLRHGHMRRMAVIKAGEGELEFGPEFLERHGGLARLREDEVGRLQYGGQIIHQRAGPVKNDVADHAYI